MQNIEGLESLRLEPAAPSTGQAVSNSNFLRAVLGELAVGQHGWVCTFTGDPHQAPPTVWGGRTFKGGPGASAVIDRASDQNAYFSVAVLQADPTEGEVRRAGAFVRLAALVADDVEPQGLHGHTWLLETSPGKHQAGVIIDPQDPDAADRDLVDRLLRAVPGAAGADQSGNACVRYVRLPQGINGKAKAHGFAMRLHHWQPGQVLSLADAAAVFGVDLDAVRSASRPAERAGHDGPRSSMREVNDAAMARLEAWVPTLFPQAKRSGQTWRVGSATLGRELQEDLSFHPDGIVDFGVADQGDAAQGKRTPIDVVAEHRTAGDVKAAADWLRQVLGMPRWEQAILEPADATAKCWVYALSQYQPPLQAWREPPPVRWAVDGLIREATVGALVAPGATGKTTLLITLGICHALGLPFMGRQVRQGGFLLLSVDDAQEDLDAAVGLVIRGMKLDPQSLEMTARYLRVLSLQGREGPRSFNAPGAPGQPDQAMLQALRQACSTVPNLVGVCLDTLRQFAGGPTNAEEVIMAVSTICATVAVETGAYIVMPHHTGKAQARDDAGDMYVGSGSAAIADNARFLLVLSEVTERNELARLAAEVQHEHNAGECTILRLASRRGSIRHKAQADLFIARRGYLMQEVTPAHHDGDARTLPVLEAISSLTKAAPTSRNAVYNRLGGKKTRLLAQIDELIECGLVTTGSPSGSQNSAQLTGLTAAGAALLRSLQSGSLEAVPP